MLTYSGAVYDAARRMGLENFLLSEKIRPLNKDSVIYGPAFTTYGEVVGGMDYGVYDKVRYNIYSHITMHDIIILQANDDTVAHSGDITSLLYSEAGAAGFVTDGLVRDSKRIRELGLPCFCSDTCPIDALDYWAITQFQVPVFLPAYSEGTVKICPGDYVFGDADGVMVIPRGQVKEFTELLHGQIAREEAIRKEIKSGKSAEYLDKVYGRW